MLLPINKGALQEPDLSFYRSESESLQAYDSALKTKTHHHCRQSIAGDDRGFNSHSKSDVSLKVKSNKEGPGNLLGLLLKHERINRAYLSIRRTQQ